MVSFPGDPLGGYFASGIDAGSVVPVALRLRDIDDLDRSVCRDSSKMWSLINDGLQLFSVGEVALVVNQHGCRRTGGSEPPYEVVASCSYSLGS